MALPSMLRRGTFRTYLLVLCLLYLMMVLLFHSDLQDSRPQAAPRQRSPTDTPRGAPTRRGDTLAPNTPAPWKRVHISQSESKDPGCVGRDAGSDFKFLEVVPGLLYVFSAYWDRRPNDFDNKDNGTYVRIMAGLRWYGVRPEVECVFTDPSGIETKVSVSYYEMCENHGRPIGGFILSCKAPLSITQRPCSVGIKQKSWTGKAHSLKVLVTDPQPNRDKFAVCVSPIFNSVDPHQLIEFIELTKSLGAQRITFYDFQVSPNVARILEHYQKTGMVSVVTWDLPEKLDQNSWYHGQLIAIQDCLYRNMHNTQYLAFNDIDEFIVPHKHADWAEMIEATFKPETQCAFQFHSAFFMKPSKSSQETQTGTKLISQVSTKRTSHFSKIRTKCMVKPYEIFEKGIHHVSKPIWADLEVVRMPEEVAFLHHYRTCMRDFGMNCDTFTNDTILAKYADSLERQVSLAVDSVHIENSDNSL